MFKNNLKFHDRKPSVAGRFYSDDPNILKKDLDELFKNSKKKISNNKVRALIVPHAGYVFSGSVAASGYNQVTDQKYENVFIIGSSHQMRYEGVSIYNIGDYISPLGKLTVNRDITDHLLKQNHFHFIDEAHLSEHSLEVQIPFIQRIIGDPKIVPILIGTDSIKTLSEVSKTLSPYFTEKNLFIISTDFSHYPSYDDALMIDNKTAEAIIENNPNHFIETIHNNMDLNINNLATCICGWTSVLVLLNLTSTKNKYTFEIVDYKNSGDQPIYSDKDRVVGYYSIMITEE